MSSERFVAMAARVVVATVGSNQSLDATKTKCTKGTTSIDTRKREKVGVCGFKILSTGIEILAFNKLTILFTCLSNL